MKNQKNLPHLTTRYFILGIVFLSLILGIFFRWYNLDHKFYSFDETYTSLRVSGYTHNEMMDELTAKNAVFELPDFQKFQRLNPEKGVAGTVKGLLDEEPQLAPAYFVVLRFWVSLLNNTVNNVIATRSFSVICGLLSILLMYLLCKELFAAKEVSWLAAALTAVSPFHVLHSQYARPYAAFAVFILLSSFTFLRAYRKNTLISWVLYVLSSVMGLWTHLLMGLVLISHFLYILILEKLKLTKSLINFLASLGLISLTSFPWIVKAFWGNVHEGRVGGIHLFSVSEVVRVNILRICRVFVDLHDMGGIIKFDNNHLTNLVRLLLMGSLLALTFYSFIYLVRKTKTREWLFVLSLAGVTGLLLGGVFRFIPSQMETRYYIPVYIGIQISVAYLLAQKIFNSINIWSWVFVGLISLGGASAVLSSQSQIWWINLPGLLTQAPEVVKVVNQSKNPLLIWEDDTNNINVHQLLGLSYKFQAPTRFTSVKSDPKIDKFFEVSNVLFLFRPSQETLVKFNDKYRLEPAYSQKDPWLWTIKLDQTHIHPD